MEPNYSVFVRAVGAWKVLAVQSLLCEGDQNSEGTSPPVPFGFRSDRLIKIQDAAAWTKLQSVHRLLIVVYLRQE